MTDGDKYLCAVTSSEGGNGAFGTWNVFLSCSF